MLQKSFYILKTMLICVILILGYFYFKLCLLYAVMSKSDELDCLILAKRLMISHPDGKKLLKYFLDATPSLEEARFPDFLFVGGLIEHFQVSAARENRKGSQHNISEIKFQRDNAELYKRKYGGFIESSFNPGFNVYGCSRESDYGEYCYKYFAESFKKNLDNHIDSLRKHNDKSCMRIFMVQYVGARLFIRNNGNFLRFYKFTDDKFLLNYLMKYKKDLDYLLIVYNDDIDVIDLAKIDSLIDLAPQNIDIGVGRYRQVGLNLFIDIDLNEL